VDILGKFLHDSTAALAIQGSLVFKAFITFPSIT
jgi:hypothetical protein